MLDFPGKVCSIIFTNGCNFKCPFCHNYELTGNAKENNEYLLDYSNIIEYLIKRKNMLDGVTITGGEPTLQSGLKEYIKDIKEKTGLLIKLDTNGTVPDVIDSLIREKLVDYIAMDIKNDFENYEEISGVRGLDVDRVKESINIIKNSKIEHEFRTTVIKNYHQIENIKNILDFVGSDSKYYLQKFITSENVPNKTLQTYSDKELEMMAINLSKSYPNVMLRGIKK